MTNAAKMKSCILCGSFSFKYMFSSRDRMLGLPGEFFIKQCSKCSLVFLDPQPSPELLRKHYPSRNYYAYNEIKKGLFEFMREYLVRHYYSPNIFSLIISTFIQNVPALPSYVKNGRVLDLGCGTGETLLLLKKIGWDVYGLDMDGNAISIGKKRGLNNLKLGTYRDLVKYPDDYFDAIRLYHVIEHIDDPYLCLSLIGKKLKKNGELLIGTPNIESVVAKVFRNYWYNLDSPRHLFLFSPDTLGKLLNKNSFIVRKVSYCSVGGILGSLQYILEDLFRKKTKLILNVGLVLIFYPLEWFLNKIGTGDVFEIRASVNSAN